MSDDTTRGPEANAPEEGELQLRKALATMNDLEPPRDDLFVQRALLRGRARTSRRRSAVLGAAAAFVVVGAVGGTWFAADRGLTPSSMSAGSAAEAQKDSGSDNGAAGPVELSRTQRPSDPGLVPSARESSQWFEGPATPQTTAFATVEPTLESRWPDVFSGAYAVDTAGTRVAVAVTRHDPELEALVTGAMPAPGDVEFVVVTHSYAEKQRVAQQIRDEALLWRSKGVNILGVTLDGRSDQVVVMADEGSSAGLIAQQYGDVVRVVPAIAGAPGKLPDGTTLPTLHQ
ncbi:hypothetical protein [Terrabacter sp. MAHUQ-38]|uniref:hypothetical protein n=1 Tax=unclassified Terrabacter TaxID=2630222 RepID=UPI00165E8EC3|nr:hypothetical protein [Terrabacter sp. MAHUQ-38]MBC9823827.1 hypothetical protein [Terrabacter sp. MAHUQ-38]